MVPASLLALIGASNVGDKRLSSETYQKLNFLLVAFYIIRICVQIPTTLMRLKSSSTLHKLSIEVFWYIQASLGFITCALGFFKGRMYDNNKPKLLKAFLDTQ